MKKNRTPLPPACVLLYGLTQDERSAVESALSPLKIPCRPVEPEDLCQTVGHLAGFPGFEARPAEELPAPQISCAVMAGVARGLLDRLLPAFKASGVQIPLKAMVTPTNQLWPFYQLLQELQREHEAMTRSRK